MDTYKVKADRKQKKTKPTGGSIYKLRAYRKGADKPAAKGKRP